MSSKEHDAYMSQPRTGLKRQEMTTLHIQNGNLRKTTVTRVFFNNGEYLDSESTETICNATE